MQEVTIKIKVNSSSPTYEQMSFLATSIMNEARDNYILYHWLEHYLSDKEYDEHRDKYTEEIVNEFIKYEILID